MVPSQTRSIDSWTKLKRTVVCLIPLTISILMLLYTGGRYLPGSIDKVALMFTDPASTIWKMTNLDLPLVGFFSQIGSVLWISGASICGFSAFIRWRTQAPNQRFTLFLGTVAMLGIVIGLDDLLVFHERLAFYYLHFGQRKVLLTYAMLCLATGVVFHHEAFIYERGFLILTLALLGLSFTADIMIDLRLVSFTIEETLMESFEESLKFLGVTAFWTYCLRVSFLALTPATAENLNSA